MENALIYLFLASIPFSENKLHTFSRDQVIPHKSNNVAIIFKNEYELQTYKGELARKTPS